VIGPLNVAAAPGMPAGRLIVPEFVTGPLTITVDPGPVGRLIVPLLVTIPPKPADVPEAKSIVPALETVVAIPVSARQLNLPPARIVKVPGGPKEVVPSSWTFAPLPMVKLAPVPNGSVNSDVPSSASKRVIPAKSGVKNFTVPRPVTVTVGL